MPGIGTTVIGTTDGIRVFPSISFSVSKIIQDKKDQYRNDSKIRAIQSRSLLDQQANVSKCMALKSKISVMKLEIDKLLQILTIKRKMFAYDSVKYAHQETLPDVYYQSKIEILNHQYTTIKAQQIISFTTLLLYELCHISIPQ